MTADDDKGSALADAAVNAKAAHDQNLYIDVSPDLLAIFFKDGNGSRNPSLSLECNKHRRQPWIRRRYAVGVTP